MKTGKTGKYIMAMLPFLVWTLSLKEVKSMPMAQVKQELIDTIKTQENKQPDKDPDVFDSWPASVKEITLKTMYVDKAKDFFAVMHESLQGNLDDMELLNARRKTLNKDIHIIHTITEDGMKTARFMVTSFFEKENGEIVLKNISDITDGKESYDVEAKIKTLAIGDEQTLLFETNDKKYDYDIVLRKNGEISIVQKWNKNKSLKLDNESEVLKFDTFLKEIFPPAYITYRDAELQELKDKGKF